MYILKFDSFKWQCSYTIRDMCCVESVLNCFDCSALYITLLGRQLKSLFISFVKKYLVAFRLHLLPLSFKLLPLVGSVGARVK